MNNATKELYIKYAQLYKTHANQYADTLTGSANNDFYLLLQSEYKKDLKEIVRREREQLKIMNKLHKMKVKADKRILSKRKASVDFDFNKLFSEQIKSKVDEYLSELFSSQNEAVDEPTADEVTEAEQVSEPAETTEEQAESPSEAKPETEAAEPRFCKECKSCQVDENGQCYCDKYDVDLDASDADSACCCECDGFFGESEE